MVFLKKGSTMKSITKFFSLLFYTLISFYVSANDDRHVNSPPPASNPQNPQSQMNNQNPSSVNQQMLREQNTRMFRNQQERKESLPAPPKTKPESSGEYVSPLEQKQK
jgi:hypothetical protein